MGKGYMVLFGATTIPRAYCNKCKKMALVIDGELQCCNNPVELKLSKKYKVEAPAYERRKMPSKKQQKEILELQGNKCLYCGKPFGSLYAKDGKVLQTKLHWDHLIPYSYLRQNKYNFVAACNICNGIKSNKMFNTVEEVYHYVEYYRKKRGIVYFEDLSPMQKIVQNNP